LLVVLCAALMAAAGLLTSPQPFTKVSYYLQFHLIAELSSVVVSFAVFATAWYGFRRTHSLRDGAISAAFLATGLADAIHTLSYKGMPDFLSVNDPGTAAGYWLLARFLVGVGLIVACHVDPKSVCGRFAPIGVIAAALAVVSGFAAIMVIHNPDSGLWFFNQKIGGLTPLKIAFEYVVIATYCYAFVALNKGCGWDTRSIRLLRYSLIIAIFAELSFTLYLSPYGYFNAIGHVLKTIAYYLVLQALFVSAISKPYEELEVLYKQAQKHGEEMQQSISRIGNALSSSLHLDEALEQIAELVADVLRAECVIAVVPSNRSNELKLAARITDVDEEVRTTVLPLAREALGTKDVASSAGGTVVSSPMVYLERALGAITILSKNGTAFSDAEIEVLQLFASHAAVAVHNSLSFELESRIANLMQKSILKSSQPDNDSIEIVPYYEPAVDGTLVGGDFYDVIELPEGKIGLCIGDVSGKGVEAAVHTAMVKYSLRAHLKTNPSPAKVLWLLSQAISEATAGEIFVTMFFGILETRTGRFIYANGGHEPPIHASSGSFKTLDTTGAILGLNYLSEYQNSEVQLHPGDTLLFFTDGISEARKGGRLFGSERIAEIVVSANGDDIAETVARIREAAVEFAGGVFKDDAAILALRLTKIQTSSAHAARGDHS